MSDEIELPFVFCGGGPMTDHLEPHFEALGRRMRELQADAARQQWWASLGEGRIFAQVCYQGEQTARVVVRRRWGRVDVVLWKNPDQVPTEKSACWAEADRDVLQVLRKLDVRYPGYAGALLPDAGGDGEAPEQDEPVGTPELELRWPVADSTKRVGSVARRLRRVPEEIGEFDDVEEEGDEFCAYLTTSRPGELLERLRTMAPKLGLPASAYALVMIGDESTRHEVAVS